MYEFKCIYVVVVVLSRFVSNTVSTQDVNLSMFMYLANHLTPQECLKFTAYLYAGSLELMALEELEQNLPLDEPCLSLLTTWNDSAGKEKSFLTVADCLRKIGHDKLAEWLSDTVFTQLSMELSNYFLQNTTVKHIETVTYQPQKTLTKSKIESCAPDRNVLFLLLDTLFMYLILMSLATLIFYSLILLVRVVKISQKILKQQKIEYKILEIGNLPQDLESEDEILDLLF